ncbi:MAG: GNAT family N-acetyltransferase [Lachnospiraceae bacterium]|nr:GNAT family N-acetyltransferase [Lachnospiraceae bacterium]
MIIEERVFQINGHELILRNAKEEDAQMLISSLKTLCGETPFLAKEPEEITLTVEEEIEFIRTQNESEGNLFLIGFCDGVYVGNCSFMGMSLCRNKHRVSMGIALLQKYTGCGIGIKMIETLVAVAKEKGIEQMELEVVTRNERAIGLYQKMGFEIFGTMPDNMKYKDGTYADVYWMMKKLK